MEHMTIKQIGQDVYVAQLSTTCILQLVPGINHAGGLGNDLISFRSWGGKNKIIYEI